MKKPKFKAGQVVMVRTESQTYPVKLVKPTGVGAWLDTLNNIEYEKRMRHLTPKERHK